MTIKNVQVKVRDFFLIKLQTIKLYQIYTITVDKLVTVTANLISHLKDIKMILHFSIPPKNHKMLLNWPISKRQ